MEQSIESHPAGNEPVCRRDVMVTMRDGIRLATDIYFPATPSGQAPGRYPVILERTPYGKDVPSRSERNQGAGRPATRAEVAAFFTARGYVVVYQDCRGRHHSEGEFVKYLSEADDGHDTCAWLVRQPWCDGNIGTKGLSYAAHTQMALACAGAPGVRAMVVDSGGFSSGYHSGIRQGGAYELKQAAWAVMFAVEHSRRSSDKSFELSPEDLDRWFRRMPWRRGDSPLTATPDYEEFLFDQWERGAFDEHWKQPGIYAAGYYLLLDEIATIHVSSWYDPYSRTAVENYAGMSQAGAPVRLVLGPWTHGNRWETFSGDADFGPAASFAGNVAPTFLDLRLRWFDRWLKDADNGADAEPRVLLFVMGGGSGRKNAQGRIDHGGSWRAETGWPVPGTQVTPFFFDGNGTLSTQKPASPTQYRDYVFDPRDPVPTLGGTVISRPPAILAGAYDQTESPQFFGCKPPYRPLSQRQDVLVFETAPLAQDVEVTGAVEFRLWVSSDCVDTDFTAKLVDVYPPNEDYPNGYAMNLTDGILRARYRDSWEEPSPLVPGDIYAVRIEAFPTSNVFKRGHRIRVDISSSNFPKFDVNPNTGEPEAKALGMKTARNRLFLDAGRPSHVLLPIVPAR